MKSPERASDRRHKPLLRKPIIDIFGNLSAHGSFQGMVLVLQLLHLLFEPFHLFGESLYLSCLSVGKIGFLAPLGPDPF